MSQQNNVFPETEANVFHARSLPGLPWRTPFTPYSHIAETLQQRAAATPDKNFLTYYDETGRAAAFTYAEFAAAVEEIARLLSSQGLTPGDRIATLLTNDPQTVLLYFGAWSAGITVVPINLGEDAERIDYILQNCSARIAFTYADQHARLTAQKAHFPDLISIVNVESGVQNALAADTPRRATAPAEVTLETECLIVYTSGTTGPPKGVVLDHGNLLADARSIAEWHQFGPEDRAMCVLPIHHVNGTVVTLMTPVYSGGSVVLHRRFRAQTFWQTLAEEGCTWCSVVPTILAFLSERGEDLSAYDLSRFRHIICGAGPLTVETARRFHAQFGVRVVHGYGLSETTCYSCFLPFDLNEADFQHWMFDCGFPSIGCPISANVMSIHDSAGNPLPPDTRGEIVIRGHNVMRYYFQRPEVNRDTFAHGWFRSGDEGFYRKGLDGRDYYFITGRLKELIIRGGVNYSPFDIDEVLNAIPGVKAAMAVGFENDFYGEEIGAYVQKDPGSSLSEEAILRACREKLPFAKCPKVVVFGETFPVTSTGKYQRNRLKSLFLEWKAVQFREKKAGD